MDKFGEFYLTQARIKEVQTRRSVRDEGDSCKARGRAAGSELTPRATRANASCAHTCQRQILDTFFLNIITMQRHVRYTLIKLRTVKPHSKRCKTVLGIHNILLLTSSVTK